MFFVFSRTFTLDFWSYFAQMDRFQAEFVNFLSFSGEEMAAKKEKNKAIKLEREFSDEEKGALIDLVREMPPLWQTTNPKHPIRHETKKLWTIIGDQFNVSGKFSKITKIICALFQPTLSIQSGHHYRMAITPFSANAACKPDPVSMMCRTNGNSKMQWNFAFLQWFILKGNYEFFVFKK
jgi:hypothetical protein